MTNYFLLAIIILLIYLIVKSNKNVQNDLGYFDINIKDICKNIDNAKKVDTNKLDVNTDCEKRVRSECPPEKTTEDQLFEEKKKFNELKLKCDDKTPPYSFYKDDRYLILDTPAMTLDEKLAIKMQESGHKAQDSMVNRAMYDKNSFLPYIEEELNEHANSIWWEDDDLDPIF
jgi:hypothetical protein